MKISFVKTCDQPISCQSVTSPTAWFGWQETLGKNTLNILSCSTFFCKNSLRSMFEAILQLHSEFESTYEIRGILKAVTLLHLLINSFPIVKSIFG